MYPDVLAVSIRKYVYPVLLLAHTVPLPPTSEAACSARPTPPSGLLQR